MRDKPRQDVHKRRGGQHKQTKEGAILRTLSKRRLVFLKQETKRT